jgi:hypothetical protein
MVQFGGRVKTTPVDAPSPLVRHFGVDDWAWRKGYDYGTILVDLDQHRVVDLLANRSVEGFRGWLEQHPGIVVIARDRPRGLRCTLLWTPTPVVSVSRVEDDKLLP